MFGILQRRIESALRDAKRQRGNGDAAAVENAQAVDKAFALFAQKVGLRQFAIGKKNLAGGAGAHAQLVLFLADPETGHTFFKTKALMPCCDAARSVTAMATQTSA